MFGFPVLAREFAEGTWVEENGSVCVAIDECMGGRLRCFYIFILLF